VRPGGHFVGLVRFNLNSCGRPTLISSMEATNLGRILCWEGAARPEGL
jgi:hypothetical protein